MKPHHQSDRKTRTPEVLHIQGTKLLLKDRPINLVTQYIERMVPIQYLRLNELEINPLDSP